MARKYKSTEPVEKVIENKPDEVVVIVNEAKPKESYFTCPFCGQEDTKIRNIDPTSSWCSKCGKCFQVVWKER